jgi:glycosyltransferase involved in cell wall biosynthesis
VLPIGGVPVAVTIHDAMPSKLPRHLTDKNRSLRAITWAAARLAEKIITDSEHSKKDLIELYRLPPEKVNVVYLGFDRTTYNSVTPNVEEQSALLRKLGIQQPYILHHGMVQLRKNLPKLIGAYQILSERLPSFDAQLVLAGPFGLGSEGIIRLASEQPYRQRIMFTGPLVSKDLALLIKGASLCVIPSLYEGFCLPMVEAMACGTPTVVANSSCLPEVSGGLLRYFHPESEEDMAATMETALQDTDLRQQLVSHGLKRASEFSWRRCAQETLTTLTSSFVPVTALS